MRFDRGGERPFELRASVRHVFSQSIIRLGLTGFGQTLCCIVREGIQIADQRNEMAWRFVTPIACAANDFDEFVIRVTTWRGATRARCVT